MATEDEKRTVQYSLLRDEEDPEAAPAHPVTSHRRPWLLQSPQLPSFLIAQLFLLALYTALFFTLPHPSLCHPQPSCPSDVVEQQRQQHHQAPHAAAPASALASRPQSPSPAPPSVPSHGTFLTGGFPPAEANRSLYPQLFDKFGHLSSVFAQPPSPAVDGAWNELLRGGNMRVSAAELGAYAEGVGSVRVVDDDDRSGDDRAEAEKGKGGDDDDDDDETIKGRPYLAKLGFYHELHCLHKMKRWLYPGYYYPGEHAGGAVLAEEKEHLEHCIEWIRTAALCRADTTLTLFEWVGGRLETKYPVPHMCVDSGELRSWSKARAVDIDREGAIEGPA